MPIMSDYLIRELPAKPKREIEYVVVSDKNSKVVLSTTNCYEAQKLANKIRACGGAATVFKETKL